MPDNKKDKDFFLESVGDVKPLKKSNKNYEEPDLTIVKHIKKSNKVQRPHHTTLITNIKIKNNKSDLTREPFQIKKKLKKGKIRIDKKLDFHGLTFDKAKKLFFKTVDDCFYSNKRCILFITGKGISTANQHTAHKRLFYGKIREGFQEWIYEKDMTLKILNVTPAGFSHGGDGAFFVYLRKNKN